jgi:hypothetical protein
VTARLDDGDEDLPLLQRDARLSHRRIRLKTLVF